MGHWQRRVAAAIVDRWWVAAGGRAVRTALTRVPLYREQVALAGCLRVEPMSVPASDLEDELYRLCPLGRGWEPGREPPLWARPTGLRRALATAGVLARGAAVLEVRTALVDRRRLTPIGPRYRVVLAPGADMAGPDRLAALDRRALAVATAAGRATLVGPPGDAEAVRHRLGLGPDGVTVVHRVAPADLASAPAGAVVLADRLLGYLGARAAGCGLAHVDWVRWQARSVDGGLALTALTGRRPTLVGVLVPAPGVTVRRCPRHGTPVLVAGGRGRAGSPPGPRPSLR